MKIAIWLKLGHFLLARKEKGAFRPILDAGRLSLRFIPFILGNCYAARISTPEILPLCKKFGYFKLPCLRFRRFFPFFLPRTNGVSHRWSLQLNYSCVSYSCLLAPTLEYISCPSSAVFYNSTCHKIGDIFQKWMKKVLPRILTKDRDTKWQFFNF